LALRPSTPFPYTTLFRSSPQGRHERVVVLVFQIILPEECQHGSISGLLRLLDHDPYGAPGAVPFGIDSRNALIGLPVVGELPVGDRKSTRLNSSHLGISY